MRAALPAMPNISDQTLLKMRYAYDDWPNVCLFLENSILCNYWSVDLNFFPIFKLLV